MRWAEVTLLVVAVLIVIALVLSHLARRIDRLHRRVLRSRAVLEEQLVRRAEAVAAVAAAGLLDPAASVILADAAWDAAVRAPRLVGSATDDLADPGSDRGLVESQLTLDVRAALGSAEDIEELRAHDGDQLIEALQHSCYRAQLARRFHNDAVIATQHLRHNRLVRLCRLAGRAALPVTFEMDDDAFPAPT